MRQLLLLLSFLVLWNGSSSAQRNNPSQRGTTLYLGGSYGIFDARRDFTNIYGFQIPIYAVQVGLGYKDALIMGKYHRFTATGKSKVVNIQITTQAEWKEDILAVGIRKYLDTSHIYFDLNYLIMKADENISTSKPVLSELASSHSIQDHGIALGAGYAPEIIGPLGIFLEMQWNYMFQEDKNSQEKTIPNLGGLFVSAGIHLTIY
jgi:hypothetical protein